MEQESAESLLNKKKNKETRKLNAARQRTHARFEALLNPGSGSEEISETTPRRSRKKERTKTADAAVIKPKRSPKVAKKRSRSHENVLNVEDKTDISSVVNSQKQVIRKKNDASIDYTDVSNVGDNQPRARRKKNPELIENTGTSNTTDNHPHTRRKKNGNLDTVTSAATKQRSKKTKQKPAEDIPTEGTDNDGYERHSFNDGVEDTQTQDDDNTVSIANGNDKENKKKKRRKKKEQKVSASDRIIQALAKKRYDDGLLLCIVVHKADQLKPDARVHHPVVRIHIVNMNTGQYIKKTEITRNVTSIFENKNVDYVLPMMTQPFDFKRNRTLTPHWEETLIYNEIYSYFLQREQDDPPAIVFFELLDFVRMNLKQREFSKTNKGWYRIAWAFLKLVSPTGSTNTDKKARLQFYQPITRVRVQKEDNAAIEIYQWWKYGTRIKYSSTLYVTVKGVFPPQELNPATRSMFATQEERGGITFEELNNTIEGTAVHSDHEASIPMWTKLPGQVNHIPNNMELALPTGRKGCSAVKFSDDGRYLACACATNDRYPVLVYEFPDGKLICSFANHFGIVYDLCWSANGKEILSASADSTVRCWDTKRFSNNAIKLFPHPSFVYTSKYHPQLQNLVITGSYDRMIRIWNKISDGFHASLLRELPANHTGYVNSLTFFSDGSRFFSGDSTGLILEWNCAIEKKKKSDAGELVNRWKLMKKIELEELKNVIINTLLLHPGEKKLLVHSRDSALRMLDLRSYSIQKLYVGGLNFKEHIHCALSTCGSFIFCGTENGLVHVWNTETGDHVFVYKDLGYLKAVSDLHFHPHDNFIVFSCYGDGQPVYVYSYDPKVHLDTKASLNKSPPATTNISETQRSLNETTEMYQSLRTAASISNNTQRMDKARAKLQSVTTSSSMDDLSITKNRVTFKDVSPRRDAMSPRKDVVSPRNNSTGQTMSTWGSDFTYTIPRSPTGFSSSPHAQQHLGASGRYFARQSSLAGSHSLGSIDMQLQENPMTYSQLESSPKPVFKFTENERVKTIVSQTSRKKVVSLYEYKPNRADELALQPNDLITVLYEDNVNWWMGQSEDGRQGYFPVNYVMEADDSYTEKKVSTSSTNPALSHSAVINKRGELKIIPGLDDSDTPDVDVQRSRRKKRRGKNRSQTDLDESKC